MVLAAFAVATNRLGDPLVLTSPGIARAGETLKDLNARHKGGGRWEAMLRTNVVSLALPLAGRLEREASELFQQGEILRGLRRTRDGLSLVECHAGLLSLVQRMEVAGRSELARLRDKAYRQEHSADDADRAEAKQIYRETIAVCSSNDWTREFLENAVRRMGP
jgi:hypothetical protein